MEVMAYGATMGESRQACALALARFSLKSVQEHMPVRMGFSPDSKASLSNDRGAIRYTVGLQGECLSGRAP